MNIDLAARIVLYADRRSKRKKIPAWSVIMDILGCGSTAAAEFFRLHCAGLGWRSTKFSDGPPLVELVWTAEELGDCPRKLLFHRIGMRWFDKRGEEVSYFPSYWMPIT